MITRKDKGKKENLIDKDEVRYINDLIYLSTQALYLLRLLRTY